MLKALNALLAFYTDSINPLRFKKAKMIIDGHAHMITPKIVETNLLIKN